MPSIQQYQIIETLYESAKSLVYRCKSVEHQKRVVIKKLNSAGPTPLEMSRFKREFEIAKSINSEGVVKVISLEPYDGSQAIVMEDIGAESLSKIMLRAKISVLDKISIATKIAQYIGSIHDRKIIHMDINPTNIIWNPSTDILKIIDFGISTEIQYEKREINNPNVLEGTLPYISPEQTGRMNRYIDYRTDLYSLGVTLYELFTGRLPFYVKDSLKLIHAHIVRQPDNPQAINDEIPAPIAAIILKLMSKDPEDRYKDSAGVVSDLAYCLAQIKKGSEIRGFEIGKKDASGRFIVPQRIYGRSKELESLIGAFDRVSGGGELELFLFGGCSGVGKTTLVSEIAKHTSRKKALYIKGKFEKSDKSPYSGLKRVFGDLVRQKLTEPKDKMVLWKEQILEDIGQNGRVLIDLLPEVEFVIGDQPTLPELPPKETENRYNHVFRKFIRTCCSKDQPLVIFIDDLQWADLPTFSFLEKFLIGNQDQYLLVIGAYRNNEINEQHPLATFITKLINEKIKLTKISMEPLTVSDIANIIQDTVNLSAEEATEISKICLSATGGVPFQLNQFLYSLYQDGLIWFDVANQSWACDIHKILKNTMTDSTVEIVMSKFKGMSDPERRLINLAACIGNQFDLRTVAMVVQAPPLKMADALESLVRRNIIYPSENYKYLKFGEDLSVVYYFVHDRIWQAAYNLYGENVRQKNHLKVGTALLKDQTTRRSVGIFDIVNQLNRASDLATGNDKIKLAGLNYEAGKKSKETAAWKSSLDYFMVSIFLMGDDSWVADYSFSLLLYIEAAESAYLVGEFDYAQNLISIALAHATNKLDQCKANKIKIDSLIAQGRHPESVKLGLEVLSNLKIKFPKSPNKLDKLKLILSTYLLLKRKKIDNLHSLENIQDERLQEACRIMMTITSSAYISGSPYFIYLITYLVKFFIKKGYHPQAPFGCATYAIILCAILHDYDFAYDLAQAAISLTDRKESQFIKSKVVYVANASIYPWKLHYKELLPTAHQHYKVAKDIGDFEFSGFNLYSYCYLHFLMGIDLSIVDNIMSKYTKEVSKQDTVYNYFRVYHQATQNLMGKSDVPWELTGNIIDEAGSVKYFEETGNRIGLFEVYSNKLHLCYLFNEYEQALNLVPVLDGFLKEALAKHNVPIVHLYQALTICAVYKDLPPKKRKNQYKAITAKIKKMRMWAQHGPNNFKHKYLLLLAEANRIKGNHGTATENYQLAISHAGKNGFVNEKALCHELAAKHYLECGNQEFFKIHIIKARDAFRKWGAIAKCRDLEKKYTEIFATNLLAPKPANNSFPTITTTTASHEVAYMDLLSAMKCSQLISSEIEINKLLDSLIKISIECAGAERGCLITVQDNEFVVQTEYGMQTEIDGPLKDSQIAKSVINFVVNTKKPLLLDDASTKNGFCDDAYIKGKNIKSLLCMPYIHKDKIIGLLYLENNQTANAFNEERIKILQIIASQAVVSIENANLYEMVTASEKRFRSIFDNSLDGIFQISPSGKLITANNSLAKILGFENADQIVGSDDHLVEFFCVGERGAKEIKKIIDQEGILKDYETDIRKKNNQIIKGMLNVHCVKDDNGQTLYYEGNIKDITELKQVQNLIIEKRAAEAKALTKSQFLANMSHDIRTPINTILGYSELLKDNLPNDPILNEYIGNISSSGRLLLSLINEILEFMKLESGKICLNAKPVSIFAMLDEIMTQFGDKIKGKGLEFNINTDLYFRDVLINIDELRLKQILINLLDNAYKFTDTGYINLNVQKNNIIGNKLDLSILVEDSGVGISDTIKIFEEFEQLQPVSDKLTEGAGLGLSIVKKLVDLMNGSISITSSQENGSKFEIRFPDIDVVEVLDTDETISQADPIGIVFDNSCVVVADDNVKNRGLIIEYLKPYGINVLEAKNGKEVIEVLQKNPVDLVLMDLKMPVMDGTQTTSIIKSDEKSKGLPVVALTADVSEESKNKAIESGCDGFLLKPISRKALLNELMRFIEHSMAGLHDKKNKLGTGIPIDYGRGKHTAIISDLQRLKDQKWRTISKTMIISDIGKFAEDVEKIGIKYQSTYFEEWGKTLKNNAMNFSNQKIQAMLSQYPELISKLGAT